MPEERALRRVARKPPKSGKKECEWKRGRKDQRQAPTPARAKIIRELPEERIDHRIPQTLDENDGTDQRRIHPQRHVVNGTDQDMQRAVGALDHRAAKPKPDLLAQRDTILRGGLVMLLGIFHRVNL